MADRFRVSLSFHGDLVFFLKREEQNCVVSRVLSHKSSVKDVIESCGVPHPEVDLILCDGCSVDFAFQVESEAAIEVFPITTELLPECRLQDRDVSAFVADGHLGKLVRELRLLGIDVSYRHDATDKQLLETAIRENRALLTRDRPLLMHKVVKSGYFPRSQDPLEQIVEVIRRFSLAEKVKPFVRCLRCNGLLASASKESLLPQLEPLTQLYYQDFLKCSQCGRAYWRGSHMAKLQKRLGMIMKRL
jgi:uncharacterized protein with PIN domain